MSFNLSRKSKTFISVICCSLLLAINVFASKIEIKSLQVFAGDEAGFPIISLSGSTPGRINIAFDVASSEYPFLSIYFRYCDAHWNPTTNNFLMNRGNEFVQSLSLSYLPTSVTEAQYHFSDYFPNDRDAVSFPFSGKWMFFVTSGYDTSIIYAKGRFIVAEDLLGLQVKTESEIKTNGNFVPYDLAKTMNIYVSFDLPMELFPQNIKHAEIIDNFKTNFPIIVSRDKAINESYYTWDGNRKFTYVAKNIIPGNEYRQVDVRNYNHFSSKKVKAQFDGLEQSRLYKKGKRDLNGGFKLTNYKDVFAEYLDITFSIRPPEPFSSDIYLAGAFNNWDINQNYKLKNSDGIYSISLLLKRGIYDYLYVTKENNKLNWVMLEGNFLETTNIYRVFIYYYDPSYGGYERIIGFTTIRINEHGKN